MDSIHERWIQWDINLKSINNRHQERNRDDILSNMSSQKKDIIYKFENDIRVIQMKEKSYKQVPILVIDVASGFKIIAHYDFEKMVITDYLFPQNKKCCRVDLLIEWTEDCINFVVPNIERKWVIELNKSYVNEKRLLYKNIFPECPYKSLPLGYDFEKHGEYIHCLNSGPICECYGLGKDEFKIYLGDESSCPCILKPN